MSYTISGGLSDIDLIVWPIDILTISGDLNFITISSYITETISGLITIITSTGEEEDYYNSWITNSWNKINSMYVLGTIDTSGGDIHIRQGSIYVGQTFNGIPVQLIHDNIYNSIYTSYYESTTPSGVIITLSSNLLPYYINSLNNTITTLEEEYNYLLDYSKTLSGIVYGNYQSDNANINTLIDTDNYLQNYSVSLSGIVYGNYHILGDRIQALDDFNISDITNTQQYLFNYSNTLSGTVNEYVFNYGHQINTLIDTDNYLQNYSNTLSGIVYGNYKLDNANINTLIDTDNYLQNYNISLSGIVYGNYHKLGDRIQALDDFNILDMTSTQQYLFNYSNTLSGTVNEYVFKYGSNINTLIDTDNYLQNYSNTLSGIVYGNYHKLGDRIQALDDFNILDMTSTQQYLFNYSTTLSGTLNEYIFKYGDQLDDLDVKMDIVESSISTLESQITTAEDDIDDLEQKTTDITYSSGVTTFSENVKITSTQESTSVISGCLTLNGGLGMKKNLVIGGYFRVASTLESTSTSTGAVWIQGGTGISKNLNVGGTTTLHDDIIINTTDGVIISDTIYKIGFENDVNTLKGFIKYNTSNGGSIGDRIKIGCETNTSSTYIFIENASPNEIVGGATTGWIGINTETPTYTLDINGDCNVSGTLTCPTITTLESRMTTAENDIDDLETKCSQITQSGGYTTMDGTVKISTLEMTGSINPFTATLTSTQNVSSPYKQCYFINGTANITLTLMSAGTDGQQITFRNTANMSGKTVTIKLNTVGYNLYSKGNYTNYGPSPNGNGNGLSFGYILTLAWCDADTSWYALYNQ